MIAAPKPNLPSAGWGRESSAPRRESRETSPPHWEDDGTPPTLLFNPCRIGHAALCDMPTTHPEPSVGFLMLRIEATRGSV